MNAPSPDDSSLDTLGRELSSRIASPSSSALARQRARFVQAAHAPRLARRGPRVFALSVAVAAAAVAAFALTRRPVPAPAALGASVGARPLALGEWVAAADAPVEIRFSDGSRVTLSPGAHARVEETSLRGARVLLERGDAEVYVTHAASTRWRFAAGPYTVDVTGTSFALGWEPSAGRFDLGMRSGRVVLRGPRCAEGLAVRGRDEVHADVLAQTLTVGPVPPQLAALGPTPQEPIPLGPTPQEPIPARPSARTRPHETVVPVTAPERAAHAAPSDDVASMLRAADDLRRSGSSLRARELLMDLRASHAGSREAAHAAYLLGLMSAGSLGAPAQAARWFELYLSEAPGGGLASDARGRLAQALHAAGDDVRARDAATRYLQHDPEGAFAPFARSILGR